MCVNFVVLGYPAAVPPEKIKGDLNVDGAVNIADIVTMNNHLLGRKPLTAELADAADMNDDGKVDVFDLIRLRRAALIVQ